MTEEVMAEWGIRMNKLEKAKMILGEYRREVQPILGHFESARIKSLRLKQGNLLTKEDYRILDDHVVKAMYILTDVLINYEDLMYEALYEKEDLE